MHVFISAILIFCAFALTASFASAEEVAAIATTHPYGALSLIPTSIAIVIAFATRQVFVALFLGIWLGAIITEGATIAAVLDGLLRVVDTYLIRALAPEDGSIDHMSVVMFTLMVGGTIGIISANGGMHGIVNWLTRYTNNRRKGQLAVFAMGFTVFFDDYANTLIVGKTLRPLTDKLKISREKLAFLVDSTAAPLACIALVTTWIGFQLSLIESSLPGIQGLEITPYELFVSSISFSFYPILMLVFIAFTVYTGRDFGAMLQAEIRASLDTTSSDFEQHDGETGAIKAVIPILVLIVATFVGLYATGEGVGLREILGSADPFKSMLWASLLSLLSAILISVATQSLSISKAVGAMEDGFKPMLLAVMILTFAWAIASINADLGTANYVVSFLGDSISPELLPVLVFVIAALTSFATGSSWGTMGILVPLVLPLTWSAMSADGAATIDNYHILYATTASVMAGAVWGDHCSPISDTTILSSLASDCPHMNHVRTQMPYALFVALVAILFCIIPSGYGVPSWITIIVGSVVLWIGVRHFGSKVATAS